jgi:AcrR family transcriptional regulator
MRQTSQGMGEDMQASGTTSGAGGTKARIQDAALDLFVRQGYEKTSLREIADQLGITKAALYYHYASKQELLKSLTQPLIDEFEHVLAAHLDRRALLIAYLDLLSRNRRVFEIFTADHSSLVAAELAERSETTRREIIRQVAGPDATPTDLVRAAAALGAITQGFVLAAGLDPAQSALEGAAERYPEGEELAELLIETGLAVLRQADRG